MSALFIYPLAASLGDAELLLILLLPALGIFALAWLHVSSETRSRDRFRELNYDNDGNPTTIKGRIHASLGPTARRSLNTMMIWGVSALALGHLFGPSFSTLEKLATIGVPTALSVAYIALIYYRIS